MVYPMKCTTAGVCAYSDGYVQPQVHSGAIPGNVTKGVITLRKKGGRHVWEELDNYWPITLLNTDLRFWPFVCSLSLAI